MKESMISYSVKVFGFFVRLLPLRAAFWVSRLVGVMVYYLDFKHRSQAYINIRMAFAGSRGPDEIRHITKQVFRNCGENIIDLLRMPLIDPSRLDEFIRVEGKEHVRAALEKEKGAILLAMHFGSWEMSSLACAGLERPYRIFVKKQEKYFQLNDLLNAYRACGGSIVLSRGAGTRDFVKCFKNNEIVGMVVDQGGRNGVPVSFLGRQASLSVGAIRMGLKLGVPLCFSIILRQGLGRHKVVFHKALELENTGDLEKDIVSNVNKIVKFMEPYVEQYPSEYMWFYKIWKYSKQKSITILSDGKVGHLRQSQAAAKIMARALKERGIETTINEVPIRFRSRFAFNVVSLLSLLFIPFFGQGRLGFLKHFLTEESFKAVIHSNGDFIVSCGSSSGCVNYLLAQDYKAKSVRVLNPGSLGFKKFDLILLPQHDSCPKLEKNKNVVMTKGALNLIDADYLSEQKDLLIRRFSCLNNNTRLKIGVFIGGDSKNIHITKQQVEGLIARLKQTSQNCNADILLTTSRRTPKEVEGLLRAELKAFDRCPLLILANEDNVPQAVGGILGLSDIVVVSGDSISMVSEAASSGKNTIAFYPQGKSRRVHLNNKHRTFMDQLNGQNHIIAVDVQDVGINIMDIAEGKKTTRIMDDHTAAFESVKRIL